MCTRRPCRRREIDAAQFRGAIELQAGFAHLGERAKALTLAVNFHRWDEDDLFLRLVCVVDGHFLRVWEKR